MQSFHREVWRLNRQKAACLAPCGRITHNQGLQIGLGCSQEIEEADVTTKNRATTATSQWTRSDEDNVRLDKFVDAMSKPSQEEEEFFARRRELGLGVGLSGAGKVIYARDVSLQ